ncbi:MAG TPA: hypothetical protein VE891_15815 [Allosphingosinicella sp.]|nr:hypothetical protein [Allosphingosinicella sp.]
MGKLSLLAVFVVTFTAGQVALAGEKAKGAPGEKKICKASATTSSRIRAKKVCKTQAEWAKGPTQEELEDAEAKIRGMSRGN